jgi:hypothetical protein
VIGAIAYAHLLDQCVEPVEESNRQLERYKTGGIFCHMSLLGLIAGASGRQR